MKSLKIFFTTLLSTFLLLLLPTLANAQSNPDFIIDTTTLIEYNTGEDFVTIQNEYVRTVKNSKYYFPKEGEKTFHIPDRNTSDERIKKEREFKLQSLVVTNDRGSAVKYTVEELAPKEGIFIHIPHYKSTTKASPYKVVMTYKTHDNIVKSGNLITLIGSSLPKDTVFEKRDSQDNTLTRFNYNFSIITDKNLQELARAFPSFKKEENNNKIYYHFYQENRIENTPTLEFGTSSIYKFELEYEAPKTDNVIPPEYSKVFKAISTNIYEISLPREFAETNQTVTVESILPIPKNIYRDAEGNVIAVFELPANEEGLIKITGTVSSSRKPYSTDNNTWKDITLEEYNKSIAESKEYGKYLIPTKYWESDDPYIKDIAQNLSKDKKTLYEVIDSVYQFVNDTLEYDESKANSDNPRIGAISALQGGASVCMEYADSMIAILRAQGIAARAALGYTNITNEPSEIIRHQWVQIWIPNYGWLSVDPTYESNDRSIGQLIDRVLWETFNEDSLSNISIFSADKSAKFQESRLSIAISAVTTIDAPEQKTYSDLLPSKNIENSTEYTVGGFFNSFFKATVLGRAILISIPIILLITSITLLLLFFKILRRKKGRQIAKKEIIRI